MWDAGIKESLLFSCVASSPLTVWLLRRENLWSAQWVDGHRPGGHVMQAKSEGLGSRASPEDSFHKRAIQTRDKTDTFTKVSVTLKGDTGPGWGSGGWEVSEGPSQSNRAWRTRPGRDLCLISSVWQGCPGRDLCLGSSVWQGQSLTKFSPAPMSAAS